MKVIDKIIAYGGNFLNIHCNVDSFRYIYFWMICRRKNSYIQQKNDHDTAIFHCDYDGNNDVFTLKTFPASRDI